MEINCTRCHQAVEADNCYCPTCGLPQLVYSADAIPGQIPPERFNEPIRDASTVDWKRAMPRVVMLAVPAGVLSSNATPLRTLGLFWMAGAAATAVFLYVRSQRPAWITMGAGARIGLVTGLMGAWLAFGVSGAALFVDRFVLHRSSQIDADWQANIAMGEQFTDQLFSGMGSDVAAQAQTAQAQNRTWMMSPEGHAGGQAFNFAASAGFLLSFAIVGGALGARLQARARRPQQ
jgi:hypothetical protein